MRNESLFWLLRDARRARKRGPEAIAQRQRTRLAEIVAHVRAQSPFFRELYKDLPDRVEDLRLLPVTDKRRMMAHYDEWVTDRAVTVEKVRAFISDRNLIGERFLDKYTALTTSGTTGTPGIFLWDDHSMTVTYVLALRMLGAWLRVRDVVRIVTSGGRVSLVCATGGHYAEAVAGARLRTRRGDTTVQVLAAQAPIGEIVAQLNRFRPAVLAPYASVGARLASEQDAGRLHINPALVVLSAEGLPEGGYDLIAKAFGIDIRHSYAATECPFISYSCDDGWLHVNSDWVVLEPVDADGRPTSPGTQSHTVLITNLANRVQPILRYDLGDRILQRPIPAGAGTGFLRSVSRVAPPTCSRSSPSAGSRSPSRRSCSRWSIRWALQGSRSCRRHRPVCVCVSSPPRAPTRTGSGRRCTRRSRAFSSSTDSATSLLSAPRNRRRNLQAASTERLFRWPLHPRRPEY